MSWFGRPAATGGRVARPHPTCGRNRPQASPPVHTEKGPVPTKDRRSLAPEAPVPVGQRLLRNLSRLALEPSAILCRCVGFQKLCILLVSHTVTAPITDPVYQKPRQNPELDAPRCACLD